MYFKINITYFNVLYFTHSILFGGCVLSPTVINEYWLIDDSFTGYRYQPINWQHFRMIRSIARFLCVLLNTACTDAKRVCRLSVNTCKWWRDGWLICPLQLLLQLLHQLVQQHTLVTHSKQTVPASFCLRVESVQSGQICFNFILVSRRKRSWQNRRLLLSPRINAIDRRVRHVALLLTYLADLIASKAPVRLLHWRCRSVVMSCHSDVCGLANYDHPMSCRPWCLKRRLWDRKRLVRIKFIILFLDQ